MKKFLEFTTDTIYFLSFLAIVTTAFVVTYALSPIDFDSSSFAKTPDTQVMGQNATNQDLIYENIYTQKDTFKVQPLVEDKNYKANVTIQKVKKGQTVSEDIVLIRNQSFELKNIKVILKSSSENEKQVKYYLVSSGQKYEISGGLEERSFAILPNDELSVGFGLDANLSINYPSEVTLKIITN